MQVQCCVCRKVREEGHWERPAPGALKGVEVSHGYCPTCLAQAHRDIRALRYQHTHQTPVAVNQ